MSEWAQRLPLMRCRAERGCASVASRGPGSESAGGVPSTAGQAEEWAATSVFLGGVAASLGFAGGRLRVKTISSLSVSTCKGGLLGHARRAAPARRARFHGDGGFTSSIPHGVSISWEIS
jgi:hypothetical protein